MSSSSEAPGEDELSTVEPLTAAHVVEGFDCGQAELNIWLVKHALQNHAAGASKTRVVTAGGRVVGFYALAMGAVARLEAPARIAKGLAAHPIPVAVLTRLGVDASMQGRGLGSALLKDAMMRVLEVSEVVGVRAVLVHAKDGRARGFYESFGFEPSPIDPYQLLLLLKDLKASCS